MITKKISVIQVIKRVCFSDSHSAYTGYGELNDNSMRLATLVDGQRKNHAIVFASQ